jgi:peptidoglycan/xylan/chitin deacetylase (PgdA/CDA1 family)
MNAVSLMYHDVVEPGQYESSGFPGADSAFYKLECVTFRNHLKAIARAIKERPASILDYPFERHSTAPFLITFDDGGISAHKRIADDLENIGWRGHFFITTNYLGSKEFLNPSQVRDLRDRGHVIGSHSCSHPTRMSQCTWRELINEWGSSIAILSDILGEKVEVASLPGGHYSRRVAEAAALQGVRFLFTSEPTMKCRSVNGCVVLGRYSVQCRTEPQTAADIASAKPGPRLNQLLLWNLKKALKAAGGRRYLKPLQSLLYRGSATCW